MKTTARVRQSDAGTWQVIEVSGTGVIVRVLAGFGRDQDRAEAYAELWNLWDEEHPAWREEGSQ